MTTINQQWTKLSTDLIQDPNNKDLWKSLIRASESIDNKHPLTKSSTLEEITILKSSYTSFLAKFPYEFKYWIKYANWEFKLGNTAQADSVYITALDELPFCIELWISYLRFKIETLGKDINSVLEAFEKARSMIGFHFYSHEFYELYLGFLDNYKDEKNGYEKKYYVLLRIILEIPIYHYGNFYKKWFDLIEKLSNDYELAKVKLVYIMPTKDYVIDKKLFLELKKSFTDAYISTQYHVFELYNFEKKLITKNSILSVQDINAWLAYIDYLEIKQYPKRLIELVYYRFLYKDMTNDLLWLKVSDFYIFHNQFNKARKALNEGLKRSNNDYKVLIKLVDLEIYLKNYQRAINLLIVYLQFNPSVPIPVREKVMQVKQLIDATSTTD
ncbi:prp39 Pre-mRNA-processing factor 39 [Candida maltosa Xu316]|uniref:Uncharacterized protein n=1 Tax=Candida maltosa (strain Xu316) TaxID=1245528 RepID=M3K1V0_CANMX|nr:hypothetical protein G210_0698 [Candida maltosa Xu316]